MDAETLTELTAARIAALIARGELGPVEVMDAYFERIERHDGRLRAYITVCREQAYEQARDAERRTGTRADQPLFGVPFAVKDQLLTRGIRTTVGSMILKEHVPDIDATAVTRLRAAGAILLGKLNMTQFGAGLGDPYDFGEARNPWDQTRSPGGSSSGSAIAVAASMCAFALGEDTGGSVRSPAAHAGIVGMRPTYGRVSRYGLFPFCWSMDAIGPMARSVEDVALILSAIAGHDPRDPVTSRIRVSEYQANLSMEVRGLRAGVITEWLDPAQTDAEVLDAFDGALRTLTELGVTTARISWPLAATVGPVMAAISDSDGAFVHREWLRTQPLLYGKNTRTRLLAAALLPSQALQKAMRLRSLIRNAWSELFREFDILVSPTTLRAAAPVEHIGPITSREEAERRFGQELNPRIPASLAGTPALSVPCGATTSGLPIGLQIMAAPFREDLLVAIGAAYERATKWHERRPRLDA
jgi:aspartyl-tRNA(Asn)/glutamyl-tRNA(Gln) amidotransferase subunit A